MQTSVSDDAGEFKVLLTRLVTRCVFTTVQRFVLMLLLLDYRMWRLDVNAQPQCLHLGIGHEVKVSNNLE